MKRCALLFLVLTLGLTVVPSIARAADFTLAPTKLSFGSEVVGTASASQDIVLKNTASGTINFTLNSLTDYTTSSSCSGTVAKGASCTLYVSFLPTATGKRSATLQVNDGVTSVNVALSGTGVLATSISPTSVAFGNVAEHSSSPTSTITLTNNQNVALNLISASGPNPDYSVLSPASGGCNGSLAPQASCNFTVVFTPRTLGTDNETLIITDDAVTSPQAVAITGAGVLALAVKPTSVAFATQIRGTTSAAKTITFSNNQSQPVNSLSLSVLGNTSDFSVSGCTPPIAALGSCKLAITFSPQASGTRTGTLVISSPDAPGGPLDVPLSGAGTPSVTISPASPVITFANTNVGLQSKPTVITVKNNQTKALIWGTSTLTGDYLVNSTTCGATGTTLAAGASCTYTLLFQPLQAGIRPGTLTLNDNAALSPQVVSLSGVGIDPVSVNLTSLVFATQFVGTPSPVKQLIATNHQDVPDSISESVTGDFTASDDCGGVIPADSSCNVWVGFDPTATGKRTGSLTITEASSSSQIAVALSGTGTNTAPTAVVANVSPGAGQAGTSLAQVVVNGTYTHFSSSSILNFGTGITFSNQQCPTLTQCTATVTIASGATPGARTVTVTTGKEVAKLTTGFAVATASGLTFQTISPENSAQGTQNLNVSLHANGAHFQQGVTYGNFGAGITVNSPIQVIDSTDAVANISISPYTPGSIPTGEPPDPGGRQITLVTGGEFVVSTLNAFQVTPDAAQIVSISPNTAQQGANLLSVLVIGTGTNFLPGATQISLGSGINIGAVNVISPSRLQFNLAVSPSATVGSYNLSVSTGGETAALANAFNVTLATPSINTVTPDSLAQCQSANVTITGILTNFVTNPPTVTFGSDITETAAPTVNSATSMTVPIQVSCTAQTGVRTGDLTTGSSDFPFSFSVPPSNAAISSVVPDSGPQGGSLISLKVTGANAHWQQGSTQAVFPSPYPPICPNIVVNRVTVIDNLDAILDITIPTGACVGANNFYMSTGGEVLNAPFSVYAATPSVAITPSSAMPGQKVPVTFISQFYQIVCPPNSGALTLATISGTGVYFSIPGESPSTSATLNGCRGGTTGTATAALFVAPTALPGSHTITLTTGDQVVTTSFNVATAQIVSITPYYAPPGSTGIPVVIVGQGTHFGATTKLSFGPGMTVPSVNAVNSALLNATIAVSSSAACGWRQAFVNTGSEQLTVGFLVNCEVPLIASIAPSTGEQGQTLSNVQVTGENTNWVQGLTTFIMGSGVTVVNTQVTDAADAILTLAVSPTAPIGPNSSTAITTDAIGNIVEVATGQGFAVTSGAGSGTLTFQSSPQIAAQSETLTLTLVGTGTHWLQGETTAAFDVGLATAVSVDAVNVTDEADASIQITVLSTASLGFHSLTLFTGGEVVTLSQALDIVSSTPVLLSTVPNQGQQGATLNVQVLGESTLWGPTTTANFGSGITVNSFLAQDSVTGLVNITVDPLAYIDVLISQTCQTVTVTTGTQQVELAQQFCIVAGPAVVTVISPTQAPLGSTLTVAVTGQNTHFRTGLTKASFGSDINTSDVLVIDTTHATVQVAVPTGASVGLHAVTMSTLGENATLAQAFTVTPQNGPTLNGVGPVSGEQGQTLTGVQLIGQFTHWTSAQPTVTFGQGITVSNVVVQNATSLTVDLAIDPLAQIGGRTVTVTTQLTGGAEIVSGHLFSAVAGPAIISAISPSRGNQGQEVILQITGVDTHWQQGLTQFYMPGVLDYLNDIRVKYVAVSSPTSVTVDLVVSPTALLGLRSIYLTTAGEAVTDASAFLITGGPAVLSVTPGSAQPGAANLNVQIIGAYTHWLTGTTTVNFGTGITVQSVTVNSDTDLTAIINIDAAAAIGYRTVTVQNGSQWLSNTFDVTLPPTPFIGYYNPISGLLGQTLTLTFSGVYTQWDPSVTTFDIGSDITLNSFQVTGLTTATANITIPSNATVGSTTITFTTGTETEQVPFTVVNNGAVQTISIVDASSGMQGQSLTVNVIGQYTAFDNTTVFNFGPGITVGTPTILGSTVANVPITVGQLATLGFRTVSAVTGGVTVQSVYPVGFTVTPSTATIASVTPNTGNQGDSGTQLQVVGMNTHWGSSTSFSFGSGINVTNMVVTDETDATLTISINPLATVGAYNLTATTSGEIASLNDAFVVVAATPIILSSAPPSAPQQGSVTFTILGQATNWQQGTTTVSFGAGITINSVTVTSPTSITATGQISPTSYTGYQTLTVATGTQQILTLPNALLVTYGPATIAALNPATADQGDTLNVEVTGANTNFNQNFTVANFGSGISVNNVTVNNSQDATVNITISPTATVQQNTVTMTTLGEVATGLQAFTIAVGPTINAVSPSSLAQGATQNVTVTGTLTSFTSTTIFSFGPGVTVNQIVSINSPLSATLNITVSPIAALGPRTVTATMGSQVATSSGNVFSVIAGPASIASVNPNTGFQNSNGLAVAITGYKTHFTQALPAVSLGPGITVTNVAVNSDTALVATMNIGQNAPVQSNPVTVTTGGEIATLAGGFTVLAAGTGPSATFNPSSAHQGTAETVVITGTNTNFGSTTTVNFGTGITTGTVTVNGPTSASVPITVGDSAATGSRNVTITTGSQVVTVSFTVIAGVPAVTLISPNTIQPTQTESVSITGAFTNWAAGTTTANFGPGIAVGGGPVGGFGPVTVNSATSLTANLVTSGASNGYRTVQIQTGSQTLTVTNGMFVETCTTNAPTVLRMSPVNGGSNIPLNTQIQAQFSAPMNRSTFTLGNSGTVIFFDTDNWFQPLPGTISLDASGTIATITPSTSLAAGHSFYTYLSWNSPYVQDACGNVLPGNYYGSFTTSFSPDTAGPTLTGTSPVNGDINIPLNGNSSATPIVLQFNTPIDPITAQTGFSMMNGSNVVLGNFTYSANDQTVTFTPVNPLTSNTTYTVGYSAQITDTAGNPLTNPGSFSFTTGTAADTTYPSVVLVDPPSSASGVGLNVTPHITFNEPVNGLTIPGALSLVYGDSGVIIPATVTLATNRLSATLTPSAALLPNTYYYVSLCYYCYYDIAGNYGYGTNSGFYTGTGAVTNPVAVTTISPSNTQTGVPLNAQIIAVMSNSIDPTTVNNGIITVTPKNGSAIAGTIRLASDGVTLTFSPAATLTASTLYNVSVGGFKDIDGNGATTFTSSFTTGTGSYGSGSFTLLSTSPASGATGVAVTSPVTFTMSNLIDPASVNSQTVEVCIGSCGSPYVAGTFSVSGATVTFTPLSPYPANQVMGMYIYGLLDEAGNGAYNGAGTFTTASTVDHTPPTVTISPANGATNVGLNTQVVLTFSKSINPSTITTNTVSLFSGDTALNWGYSISRDNRTVIMNPNANAFTSGATITVALSSGIQDFSGNALSNMTSQFTLTTELSNTAPYVTAMRPGNGATNVPANTVVTLFTSAPMNAGTITGALHVTDNGVVVSGSVQTFSNAQAIEFTPSAPFNAGDLIQVYLNSTALSASGAALSNFSGQFTVAGSPANTAATVLAINPFPNTTSVPLNTILQVEYNQSLTAGTITSSNVTLYEYSSGTHLTPSLSLVGNGQVINIAPTSNLVAGSQYQVYVSSGVTNSDGLAVQAYSFYFTAGTAADTAAPTILSQAPTNNSTNIATNTLVAVTFNKAINPISVNGSTIQLSTGSITEVPSSISFSPDYTRVSITPQAPLPASTQMTVAIGGVTSLAGKSVAAETTHFTTAAQPNFTAPYVLNPSVQSGQTNVPVNSAFTMQFNEPMDIGSLDVATIGVGSCCWQALPATVSWSADQTTVFIVPSTPLAVGTQYYLYSYSLTDLAGNIQQGFNASFTTSFSANTNPPTVINTSPENTETQVPTNAPVQILFSEPINPASIGQVALTTGGNQVAFTPTFSDANQLLTLTPALPLLPNANYTLTIAGVQDTAGNKMASSVTNTFATGPTFDLLAPQVTLTDPPSGAINVGTNVAPRIVFNERLNPLSIVSSSNELYYSGSVGLYNNATSQYVPVTVSMTADRTTAIITPNSALQPNTSYQIVVRYYDYFDVAGNTGYGYGGNFVTAAGSDTSHATVSTISPVNAQTGVPRNAQIVAVMSDEIDPTSITSNSITVTPSGSSAIAGTVTLAGDGITITFVPAAALNASTVYNVSVGGFNDVQGNTVTTSTSSFTTGTSSYGSGSFSLVLTNPGNGATNVSVTNPVTFTMNNLIDPASVNSQTVEVCIGGCGSEYVAGTFSINGATVTFTPLTPYPANQVMGMYIYGLTDEAGNGAYNYAGTFTTASTVDHTPPTVTISPANGATNVGRNTQVVLTFSKSINPATINSGSVNLLNGDTPINPATSISRDNRTVILNYNSSTLPAGAIITVTATNQIADLSGNALANTTSQFTTTPAVLNSAPYVISMRPGNGATNVPANTVITLFTSAPMNAGTLAGALYVSQNGVLISGTTTVGSNGQSIEFTPSSALGAGASVKVFLNSTAQDIYGNYLTYFSGQFTVAGSPANTAATVQAVNPFPNAASVPLNTVIQVEYNQALAANTISSSSVHLYQYSTGTTLAPTLSLVGNGQVINIAPTSNLVSGSQYQVCIYNVTNTDGVAAQNYCFNFTAGSAADTVKPTILTVGPPNASTNIGTNAGVSVTFNKAVNPVSITGNSIQLSGGSVTEVPSSISFTPDYARTIIIPQAPLPTSTQMAIAISGVTSEAGVAATSQTTHFTTMAGADFTAPYVVNSSVQGGQTVGTNAAFALQFSKPIDEGSLDGATVGVGSCCWQPLPATISWSADLTTLFIVPASPLAVGTQYYLYSYYLTDLSGNPQQGFNVNFNTGTGTVTAGPAVQQVSPPSGFTGVPINAPVQILFNEAISPVSLTGVTLKQGTSVIPTTVSLYDGDQGLQLLPQVPLATGTTYTINVTGVVDITGNAQTSFPSQSFTTGMGTGLVAPTVVSTVPANGQSNVADNTTVQVVFNEAMDPASFDPNNSFTLHDSSNKVVPAAITFSADYKTVTLHPNSNLTGGGASYTMYIGWYSTPPLQDLGGNVGGYTYFSFTTH